MKEKIKWLPYLLCLILLVSCHKNEDDPGPLSPIAGVWAGNHAVFNLNPEGIIPAFNVTEDNFPVKLEFKTDGTLILTKGSTVTTGTYQLNDRDLVINIDYTFEYLAMAGTYHIEALTPTELRASIEKNGTFKQPDTGQEFNGKVKATLYFDRKN
jgi:hypothetical protein